MNYQEFISKKIRRFNDAGFEPDKLHQQLFDFQQFIVKKALIAAYLSAYTL